ncbi:MAG TPA: bifunctional lysylphosphatidylglycerol flippase/synthetase MprF [Woeseiaceae bacterium]|nr:bifunctional lysylphosphatidylglycerol flippase/synthetase MprF [Woeseiaceae bacterium]
MSVTFSGSATLKRLTSLLGPIVSIAMLLVALWLLHRELAGLSRAEIVDHVQSIPLFALLLAVLFAGCGYLVLTVYDAMALRYLGKSFPYWRSALISFMAFAVGHNVGFVTLTGGAIRYRMYTLAGLAAGDIARIIAFVTLTFAVGVSALLGVAFLLVPVSETTVHWFPPEAFTIGGIGLLLFPLAYLAVSFLRQAPITFRHLRIPIPRPRFAIAQIAVSVLDISFACASLYILLAPGLDMGFIPFLGIYLIAMGVGVASSVPGGIGVFEAVMVAAFPHVETAVMLGTMIVYRLVYYVLPLGFALVLLASHVSHQHTDTIKRSSDIVRKWLSGIAPQVIGAAVFLAGIVLLISGASPAIESRLLLISRELPLAVLELSHLTGSVVGLALLILARGLFRRLHGAYLTGVFALLLGMGMSLLKGLDYEEALVLGCILLVLWLARDEFYRTGSVAAQRFSTRWAAAVVLALCFATWVGFVSFRDVQYSDKLWWQFAVDAEAPRMLRASVVTTVAAMAFALWKLFHSLSRATMPEIDAEPAEQILEVLTSAHNTSANLALLGDKRFLWSDDRRAFIMYQVAGDSWIAMGDPVGPEQYHAELVWAFRELVDRYDGRVVFYQVSDRSLSLYVDLGLVLAKLGEDARVPLSDFTLEGSHRAELRQALNRVRKGGAVFEVVPRAAVERIVPDLRRVSDSWLADKSTAEKGFSLGSFSAAYIANFDCAVVRVNNEIVAFANLWPAPAAAELSIDIMRYDRNAPKGVMDFLFTELMLWSAARSYLWFSLGMAPLSGMERRALAPLWHKTGHVIFTHGERFYNFEGLRRYKEKFGPHWEARYLACPSGWASVPLALLDVSRLISGGVTRIIGK